jgi:hypothetical protein
MTSAKPPGPSPQASPRIACYGTAFLADSIDAKLLTQGIAADVPQFSSPRLDASFLINCGRLLSGQLATMEGAPTSTYVKRIAGSDFRSPKGTVIYQCSTELQDLLAALTPKCAAEMATEWYSVYPKTQPAEPNGRTQIRFEIIKNLAALAIQGKDRQTKLMLRVEYRKQR